MAYLTIQSLSVQALKESRVGDERFLSNWVIVLNGKKNAKGNA
jgi:hypothetical protein